MKNEALDSYHAFFLDVDGVLVRGGEVIPGAIEGVAKLQRIGRVLLLSNNSTRSRKQVASSLKKAGFPIEEQDIVNSAFIASEYLRDHYGLLRVWVLGEEGLGLEIAAAGHRLVAPQEAEWIVAGMDRSLNYGKLTKALVALSTCGGRFLATNTDRTFPTTDGPRPGAGATIGALTGMGYPPTVIVGKPAKIAFDVALEMAGCTPSQVLMIGDRMETDILGASGAGIDSALVLTGVTQREMIQTHAYAPRFVADSLHALANGNLCG